MTIELTEQQQQALDSDGETPPRVIDPRTNATYVLISEFDYEGICEALEDDCQQRAFRATGLRNGIGRIGEEP